jgi:ubiquinol-cytochrome c reductase cytochrome b subunit
VTHQGKMRGLVFYPLNKWLFWFLIGAVAVLTWIGAKPVEAPYVFVGQVYTVLYFGYFLFIPNVFYLWDKLLD